MTRKTRKGQRLTPTLCQQARPPKEGIALHPTPVPVFTFPGSASCPTITQSIISSLVPGRSQSSRTTSSAQKRASAGPPAAPRPTWATSRSPRSEPAKRPSSPAEFRKRRPPEKPSAAAARAANWPGSGTARPDGAAPSLGAPAMHSSAASKPARRPASRTRASVLQSAARSDRKALKRLPTGSHGGASCAETPAPSRANSSQYVRTWATNDRSPTPASRTASRPLVPSRAAASANPREGSGSSACKQCQAFMIHPDRISTRSSSPRCGVGVASREFGRTRAQPSPGSRASLMSPSTAAMAPSTIKMRHLGGGCCCAAARL